MENRANLKKGIIAIIIAAFIILSLRVAYIIMFKYYAVLTTKGYISNVYSSLIFPIMESVKAVVISVVSVVFGPIAGFILGLIDRLVYRLVLFTTSSYYSHGRIIRGNIISLQSLSFLLYGISIGALWKYFDFLNKAMKMRSMIVFIVCQTFASFLFRLFLPTFFDGVQGGRISLQYVFHSPYFWMESKFIGLIVVLSTIVLYLFVKKINSEANAKDTLETQL